MAPNTLVSLRQTVENRGAVCVFPRTAALASLCKETEKQASLGGTRQASAKNTFGPKMGLDGHMQRLYLGTSLFFIFLLHVEF